MSAGPVNGCSAARLVLTASNTIRRQTERWCAARREDLLQARRHRGGGGLRDVCPPTHFDGPDVTPPVLGLTSVQPLSSGPPETRGDRKRSSPNSSSPALGASGHRPSAM